MLATYRRQRPFSRGGQELIGELKQQHWEKEKLCDTRRAPLRRREDE